MLKIIPKVIKYINDDPKHDKVYEQSSNSSCWEREREKGEKPYFHSSNLYLQLRDIYIQG